MKSDEQPEVRVLKTATCPSLSGKSKLTYQVGAAVNADGVCTPKAEIYIRLNGNSGGGFYNDDWIALTAVEQILDKLKRLTCTTLAQFFKKKSVNSAGFFLSCLKAEGLVRPSTEDKRAYEPGDPKAYRVVVEALLRKSPASTKAIGKQAKPAVVETKPSAPTAATPRKASGKKKA